MQGVLMKRTKSQELKDVTVMDICKEPQSIEPPFTSITKNFRQFKEGFDQMWEGIAIASSAESQTSAPCCTT